MPKNRLDPQEEKFAELTGLHGYRDVEACREVWPTLTTQATYSKVRRLAKNALVQTRVEHWNSLAMAEPRRLLKIAHRSASTILSDPSHKNYTGTLHAYVAMAKPEKDVEVDKPVNVTLNLKLEE